MSRRARAIAASFLVSASLSVAAVRSATDLRPSRAPEAEEQVSVRSLLELARQRAAEQDLRGAADALRRALRVAPNSEEVLSAYARVSLTARAPVPAVLALEPLTRMHPTVSEYPYLLGVAWMQLGDMASAVEALRRAVELDPGRALAHTALGMALNQQKRYAEARRALGEALRREPEDVEALAALAESEEGLGELAAAEARVRRVLERDPDHATALLVLGMVEMKQERFADARRALEAALAVDPDSAKAHYQLSLACSRLGDEEGARKHLEDYRRVQAEVERRLEELYRLPDAPGDPSP